MNRLKAVLVLTIGINVGIHIDSNIWKPKEENIPIAVLSIITALAWIYSIKEPKESEEEKISAIDENVVFQPKSLSKFEAMLAMQEGKKVNHTYFAQHEWVKLTPTGDYEFDDGYFCPAEFFWNCRQGKEWETGWSLYSDSLPHGCVDPLFEIKGCDMPKGSCRACCGKDR